MQINPFPKEIWLYIFHSGLDLADLSRTSQVCKLFHGLLSHVSFEGKWKAGFAERFSVKYVSKGNSTWKFLFNKNVTLGAQSWKMEQQIFELAMQWGEVVVQKEGNEKEKIYVWCHLQPYTSGIGAKNIKFWLLASKIYREIGAKPHADRCYGNAIELGYNEVDHFEEKERASSKNSKELEQLFFGKVLEWVKVIIQKDGNHVEKDNATYLLADFRDGITKKNLEFWLLYAKLCESIGNHYGAGCLYQNAGALGDVEAMYLAGSYLYDGESKNMGIHWLKKAARRGHPLAQDFLAEIGEKKYACTIM